MVIGVAETADGRFDKRGLASLQIKHFETGDLNKAVFDYVDPSHHISARTIREHSKEFVVITIPSAESTLLFARKENPAAGLMQGRIYIRNSCAESTEAKRAEDVREIIERIVRFRLQKGNGA